MKYCEGCGFLSIREIELGIWEHYCRKNHNLKDKNCPDKTVPRGKDES